MALKFWLAHFLGFGHQNLGVSQKLESWPQKRDTLIYRVFHLLNQLFIVLAHPWSVNKSIIIICHCIISELIESMISTFWSTLCFSNMHKIPPHTCSCLVSIHHLSVALISKCSYYLIFEVICLCFSVQ